MPAKIAKIAKANVALLRQETQFSCCAASIASALKAHGKDMTEAGVNKVLGASPMGGATWEAMLATVQYFGLRGTLVVPSTIAQLKGWTDAGIPVVIAWNPEGRPWSHASCVFHVDDEQNVHVMDPNIPDPSETVRVVPKSEFYRKWAEAVGDNLIVRRPAMSVEREVTVDGRQVMASGKEAIFFQGVTREMDRLRREKLAPPSRSPSHPAPPSWRKLKEEEEAPKVKSWVGRLFDKTGESEEGIMAGKKERRSLKDKGMARFLERGPVRPADKSDAAKAMSKAQWELRKEEGRAGLPGAGLGAGYHKDKSQYNRGEGKGIEREAESLTQPLMTRRDYGAVTASDYASILKYAVNLPADVERYVEEGTDAGMPEDKAWAVAWSRYCKYKNPESEHCQMNESEYFPGRKAKFERGVSMTVDEVAEVVGPEFKEMNEDPPESVKKVMEGMQGKTARRSPLLAMEQFADMLRDGKFEEGVPADPTENMSPEDAAEWERQTEEHKDEFKTADLEAVLHRDDDGTVPFDLFFNRTAAVTAGGKYGFTKGTESACTAGVNKLQKSASRIAKALYAKDEGSPAFLAKHAARAGSKTASMLLKAMESIGPMAALAKNGKTAGKSGNGLYGFSEKTAKLGLDACTALHHEAGMIAGDLFARKGADPMKVAGYLAANAKKGKCAFSDLLAEVAPDVALEVTGTVKKKAAGGFDTNYIGGSSYSISAPKAWLEKLIAAFPKSFPRPRIMPNPNGPNDSLFTKNEKVVRAAEKWFSENGLQMTKKASDFLASDDTAEDDEVADIISKC